MKCVALVLMLTVCVVRGQDLRKRIEDAVEALERDLEEEQAPEERGVKTETDVEKRGVYYSQPGFDQNQSFSCDYGMALKAVFSIHGQYFHDRLWTLACQGDGLSGARACSWTGWVNSWDASFDFDCDHNGYIAGMQSQHDNGTEDRKYKFYCCHVAGKCRRECHETGYTNFGAEISFVAPSDKLLTGVQSYHDNGREDRRFKFTACKVQNC